MRNISFAKTLDQIRQRTKTVTRRTGWAWLEEGTLLRPVEKAMGLKKGEKVQPIFDDGTCIRVVSVRRERLDAIEEHDRDCYHCGGRGWVVGYTDTSGLGTERVDCNSRRCCAGKMNDECAAEGFPGVAGAEFVDFFCREMRCKPDTEVTRIEFEYVEGGDRG